MSNVESPVGDSSLYVFQRFVLNKTCQKKLHEMKPKFGFGGFGEIVFYRTYSRLKPDKSYESWAECVIRVVNGIFSIRKNWYLTNHIQWHEKYWQEYATGLAYSLFRMEWCPPGRGLWMCGTEYLYQRGGMSLYNCFSGETEFYTKNGCVKLKDAVDQEVEVLTSKNTFQKAIVKSFGVQKINRVTFKPGHEFYKRPYKTNYKINYDVTKDHRWLLADGTETTQLKRGDQVRVKAKLGFDLDKNSSEYNEGFCHGLIFADGTQNTYYKERFPIRLCGWKNKYLQTLQNSKFYRTHCTPPSFDGDNHVTLVSDKINLKKLPGDSKSLTYKKGFIDAWIEFDSHLVCRANYTVLSIHLDTSSSEACEWVLKNGPLLGYIPTGHNIDNKDTNYEKRTFPLNRITLSKEDVIFIVTNISWQTVEENVYCVVEPETKSFILAHGIPTGNCGYLRIENDISNDFAWAMDALMCGVGVGFTPVRNDALRLYNPLLIYDHEIEDSREGWVQSQKLLFDAYLYPNGKMPRFYYDKIRPYGAHIAGFGGVASGPEPLKHLHDQTRYFCNRFIREKGYDSVMLKTDIMNIIGCIVTSGGVRRSAEIALGLLNDPVFKDLKDYTKYPYRTPFGWMSNNTITLIEDSDFEKLDEIAVRCKKHGEPAIANLRNFIFGRIGKNDDVRRDKGTGLNPCGEIILESKELCNVGETFPTRCATEEVLLKAQEYCTFYCSTVSLLPTHQPDTNKIIARNRRIGVGLVDFILWKTQIGTNQVTRLCRKGYERIREVNKQLAEEAGIPESIRVTTVKPGGSVPKLAGCTAGIMYPNFRWMIRRIRIQEGSSISTLLKEANIPWEKDFYSENTEVFEYPTFCGSKTIKTVDETTLWEQAMNVVLLQREWADNAVSNTLNFKPEWVLVKEYAGEEMVWILHEFISFDEAVRIIKIEKDPEIIVEPKIGTSVGKFKIIIDRERNELKVFRYDPKHEENDIESVLSAIAPLIKNVSLLPHTPKGVYKQMPEEGITEEEYNRRVAQIKPIDWSKLRGDVEIETDKYCSGDACEIIR